MATKLIIKQRMAELGVTNKDLAELTGMTEANIGYIVRGKATPNLANLDKIAQALRCNVRDLIASDDEQYIVCPNCGHKLKIVHDKDNTDNNNDK